MARRNSTQQRGAALVFAISLLAIFSVLGTAYVVSMATELDAADLRIREARATHLAEAGLQAAIGDLGIAVREGRQRGLLGESTYQFPAYKGVYTGERVLLERTERVSMATVSVFDESGKANLNHVPVSVMQLLLGVDGQTARLISTSLPGRPFFAGEHPEQRRWLHGADELAERGWLSDEAAGAFDASLVTLFSVAPNDARPSRYLNVNTAPAEVLAAVLDMPVDDARQVMLRRPFQSIQELEEAAGKPASEFNIKAGPEETGGLPRALAFESRAFRLVSEGVFGTSERGSDQSRARVEAVVVFDTDGGYEITYWNAGPAPDTTAAADAAPEPEGEAISADPAEGGAAAPEAVS
jgi:type II secretory pathway component PulK